MSTFCKVNGFWLDVAKGTPVLDRIAIGNVSRAFSGTMIKDVRAHKRLLTMSTPPIEKSKALFYERLVQGMTEGSNLLADNASTFESGVSGLTVNNSGTITQHDDTPAYSHSGTYCAKYDPGASGTGFYTNGISADAGRVHCHFWCNGPGSSIVSAQLRDLDNTQYGDAIVFEPGQGIEDWAHCYCEIDLEQDTTDLVLRLVCTGTIYVDDILITQETDPILDVAGTFDHGTAYRPTVMVGEVTRSVITSGTIGGTWHNDLRKLDLLFEEV